MKKERLKNSPSNHYSGELVDMHNHSLYGIDDGPVDLETSVQMILQAKEQGVKKIILTPHVRLKTRDVKGSLSKFIKRSTEKFESLQHELKKRNIDVEISLGAELFCHRDVVLAIKKCILDNEIQVEDLQKLCLGNSKNLLIEFSSNVYPIWLEEVAKIFKQLGFGIIIAHIERYQWAKKRIQSIGKLYNKGIRFQVNVESCMQRQLFRVNFATELIRAGVISYIGSDAHNLKNRPQNLQKLSNLNVDTRNHVNNLLYNNSRLW